MLDPKKIHGVPAITCRTEAEARLDLPAGWESVTYRGVWRIPVPPYRPPVHVFTDAYTAADLDASGWVRAPGPES